MGHTLQTNERIDELVNRCLSFVDQRGRVISKMSTGVNSSLEMKYDVDDLAFHFRAYRHAMGNGSCYVQVKKGEDVVFEAGGCFTACAWGMEPKVYQPGDWEKVLPPPRRR